MKKLSLLILGLCVLIHFNLLAQEENTLVGKKVDKFPFIVYTEKNDKMNHYVPSGWMGDYGDLKINDRWTNQPQSGKTCMQIKYTAARKQGAGWAGIYWQNPANNWGTQKGGFNLTGSKKLFFYARGEKGSEVVEFKIGGITGEYNDSTMNTSGTIELKKTWELYEIDLEGSDLSYISGGFCFVLSDQGNPDGCTFCIDNIYYSDKTSASETNLGKPKK